MAGIGGQVINSVAKVMFSRNSYSILRRGRFSIIPKSIKYSTTTQDTGEKDPAPLFFSDDVQSLLKMLTRPDDTKIFRRRRDGRKIQDPEMKFMTEAELEKARQTAKERGAKRLQMPPVVKKRQEIDAVLSKDPAIQGHDTATYVFTDISLDVNEYERLIVMREPNGILRHAKWAERQRFNQMYFPRLGRELTAPRMFQEEFLQDLIKRQEYEFILDRACLQYEPNDPEYHRITETVYTAVNDEKHYNFLRSTRHFGPFAFYLAWTKNIHNLLIENITTDRLDEACALIKLYNRLNPEARSARIKHDGDDFAFIRSYASLESPIRGKVEVALKTLKEFRAARDVVAEGIKQAHGL